MEAEEQWRQLSPREGENEACLSLPCGGRKVKRPKDKRLNLPTRMEASLGLPCYAEGKKKTKREYSITSPNGKV